MPLMPERVSVLQAVLGCTESVALGLERAAVWTSAARRQILLHQGDHHRQCHLVISGSADIRVLGREGQYIQIATVEPGEFFGVYPEPGHARADVLAQNAVDMVSLDAAHLAKAAVDHSEIGAGLARIFAGQLASVLSAASIAAPTPSRSFTSCVANWGLLHPSP
jgi:CRP/FNR family transcriptional regulator, cyclic AMP receptor protein